ILFSVQHHVGMITLNRPNALNALTFPMFKALLSQLLDWQQDDAVHAVVIQAVPGRAFCAGGDVRWVYEVGQTKPEVPLELFKHEYRLNHLISKLGKPYIALMDGLTIGGGVGVTLHGSHTVASERFAFTMPEVSIGFFPDIGSSHLLSACSGGFGTYLGLTGRRANAADSKTLGFVGYTIPSTSFPLILDDLYAADLSTQADVTVSRCLNQYQETMPAGSAAEEADAVSRAFENKQALREVFEGLGNEDSDWARETHALLQQQSPLSLHVTLEQLKRAKNLSLAECLAVDYGLAYHFLKDHDFYEGVRARLVDKDKAPQWQPATWEAVSDDEISHYFELPTDVPLLW
ncbi:MAG: enoyl-CoA hydratase/isomerase family protein, partial [Gammaproteobacteria bacterium]|nr:enoyl-CoA hydratase/isomerase family protein [Gammaproteobacteria bacterium]